MIYDILANLEAYPFGPAWRKALGFLRSVNAEHPDGTYEIEGRDIYADVSSYSTMPAEGAMLEAHRIYADIQVVLAGSEKARVWNASGLRPKSEYDQERDIVFFDPPGAPDSEILLVPGRFALFLPGDAAGRRRPQLTRSV